MIQPCQGCGMDLEGADPQLLEKEQTPEVQAETWAQNATL